MILVILLLVISSLIINQPTYALSPPILSDPPNNSIISSGPKLNWQPVADSFQYKVIIDDEPSIASPYFKNPYYTNNIYYSPQLSPGSYYWKVGAKDSSGIWFWSNIWSFTLQTSNSTPSPSTTPTPSLIPTPTSSNSPSSSSFTISNIPSQINSDQSFNVSVNLSLPNDPNTNFYLKGAFKKSDSSNYFGLTKVSGDWVKNGSSYSSQYQITTDSSGNWSGNLEVKPDSEDSGFTGTGDYIFKVGKYNAEDTSPSVSWSDNESTVRIISVGNNQSGTSSSASPSPTSKSSNSPSSAKTKTTAPSQSKSYDRLVYHSASVAGAKAFASASVSSSPTVELKDQKRINPFLWVGLIFILIGVGSIGYIYLKKNGKLPI